MFIWSLKSIKNVVAICEAYGEHCCCYCPVLQLIRNAIQLTEMNEF